MKKISLMMWQGLMLSALALGFASCEPSDKPCPNKKEADGNTDQGVTVVLEMEDVNTGEITTNTLRAGSKRFTVYGNDGDVQVNGTGFKPKPPKTDDIQVDLIYFGKENVVFQGWSWRYYEDPKSTHRGHTEEMIDDFLPTVALQTEAGLQQLELSPDQTSFVCKYKANTQNKVLVKVRYEKKNVLKFPPKIPLEKVPRDFWLYCAMVDRIAPEKYVNIAQGNDKLYADQSELYLWYFLGRPVPAKLNSENLPDPTQLIEVVNPANKTRLQVPLHYAAKLSYYDCSTKFIVQNLEKYFKQLKDARELLYVEYSGTLDRAEKAKLKAQLDKQDKLIADTQTAFDAIDPIVEQWNAFPPRSFNPGDLTVDPSL